MLWNINNNITCLICSDVKKIQIKLEKIIQCLKYILNQLTSEEKKSQLLDTGSRTK